MENIIVLEPWWRFGAAIFFGALIGLEREFVQQRADAGSFAGVRTFALISLFGAMAAYAGQLVDPSVFLIGYGGYALLMVGSRVASLLRGGTEGMTTEVVAILAPLLGALVIWDQGRVAAALSVVIALVLSLKPPLHRLARTMTSQELRATLQFGLISLVVLPLLPNMEIDPLGVLNPFQIWVFVILVSGISFLGYLLMKFGSPEQGTGIIGVVGGLVSSTATTVSFAGRSKEGEAMARFAGVAIILATTISYPRILLLALAIHPPLLISLIPPFAAMLVAGTVTAYIAWRRREPGSVHNLGETIEVSNPLRLRTAFLFALLFAVVLVVVKLATDAFGSAGLYVTSGLSGFTGVDSITLTAARLAAGADLTPASATLAILLASAVNMLFKLGLVQAMGSRQLRRILLPPFVAIIATGGLVAAVSLGLLGA